MIEIVNLEKKYGELTVFNNFNGEIKEGELIAIVGGSGKGKSTLLNIIGLLDNEYKGRVLINNIDLKSLKPRKRKKFIRENISYLFQNYALIDENTILENLLLALMYTDLSKEEKMNSIYETLKTVKIDKELNTKIYTLSGGEQQRVAFARTILKPSKIILADEPTGNLDTLNKEHIRNLLMLIREMGKTVIIVTHDQEMASICDRIITLDSILKK